jgi:hypothetical protein
MVQKYFSPLGLTGFFCNGEIVLWARRIFTATPFIYSSQRTHAGQLEFCEINATRVIGRFRPLFPLAFLWRVAILRAPMAVQNQERRTCW